MRNSRSRFQGIQPTIARIVRSTGITPDERTVQAIDLVAAKRDSKGQWLPGTLHPGVMPVAMDEGEGHPSRWKTLRALRVLYWDSEGIE